mmetsp:Transcript_16092/g.50441  ORF Transcript_16092/g.50441 Transcript_16092/m.50441 type:complete len:242 (+) Transcript_16092:103-828(+)
MLLLLGLGGVVEFAKNLEDVGLELELGIGESADVLEEGVEIEVGVEEEVVELVEDVLDGVDVGHVVEELPGDGVGRLDGGVGHGLLEPGLETRVDALDVGEGPDEEIPHLGGVRLGVGLLLGPLELGLSAKLGVDLVSSRRVVLPERVLQFRRELVLPGLERLVGRGRFVVRLLREERRLGAERGRGDCAQLDERRRLRPVSQVRQRDAPALVDRGVVLPNHHLRRRPDKADGRHLGVARE